MAAPKPKPRCKNCGDETTFPSTADAGRLTRGWCVECYRQWRATYRVDRLGREEWKDTARRDIHERSRWDSPAGSAD